MESQILNEIKNQLYEAEGLVELLIQREEIESSLLPLLRNRLTTALSLTNHVSEPENMENTSETEFQQQEETDTPAEQEEEKAIPKVGTEERDVTANSHTSQKPLRPALCLNDRYRFRRALFNASDTELNDALDQAGKFQNYEEAEDYYFGVLGFDSSDEEVMDFMEIIKTYIES